MSGLLCYTSRVKSYAEPVQDESVLTGRFCGNRHLFCPSCGNSRAIIHGLSAPVSREGILKKRSLWLSAAGALVAAIVLAGCGTTTYFAGRTLPPSGLPNRVLIAVQNPSVARQRRTDLCGRLLRYSLQLQPEGCRLQHHRILRRSCRSRSRTCPRSRSARFMVPATVLAR